MSDKINSTEAGGKLSLSTKWSYAIGQFGDSMPYNLFFVYFLYYLTDVAGVVPFIAGLINMIAISWNAVANPIVGLLSDTSKSKYGRRRPFMLIGIPLIAIALILLFLPVGFEGGAKNVYFILVSMLFWTAYVTYVIPYVALGAEITQDYNERNSLRGLCNMVGYTVLMICTAAPMAIQGAMLKEGYTVQQAWTFTACLFAGLVVVFCLISWRATKGKELKGGQEIMNVEKTNLIKIFRETFKISAYRKLIVMVVLFVIGFNVINSTLVYLLTYNAGLAPAQQSIFWIVYCLIIVFGMPILIKLSAKLGKKMMLIGATVIAIIANILFFFVIGIHDIVSLYSYAVVLGLTSSTFWLLYISLVYDISEIDEFVNGKRREGSLIAIVLFVQKIGAAFAMWLTGIMLTMVGYNPVAEQTQDALRGILMLCTIIPAGFYIVSMIVFSRYPVTIEKFNALKEALEQKKEGKEYSIEKFKDIIK